MKDKATIVIFTFLFCFICFGCAQKNNEKSIIQYSIKLNQIQLDALKTKGLKIVVEDVQFIEEDIGARVFMKNKKSDALLKIGSIFKSPSNVEKESFIFSVDMNDDYLDNLQKDKEIEFVIKPFNFRDSTISLNRRIISIEEIKIIE